MSQTLQLLFPVGRIVAGSLYTANTKDAEGKPLVIKNGPDAGKPTQQFFFALAIPKQPGHTHWAQTEWGQKIWGVGAAAFPQACQSPAFAWKVKDGDSQVPNKRGRKPADSEGWPGHWIVMFSSSFAPKVYQIPPGAKDPVIWPDKDAVNAGDYAEVWGTVAGNGSVSQPGVFMNHGMVCFRGYGQRIITGPDAGAVGFGQAAAPQAASNVPVGSTALPVPATPAAPVMMPPVPVAAAPVVPVPMPAIPAASIPPHIPGAPVAPTPLPPIPAAAPPAGPQGTPKLAASGFTLDQFRAQGWSDDALRANGYII